MDRGHRGAPVGAPAPRFARPFVAAFLATLVVCALAGWNLWPFSSWELFSRLRVDRQTGWEAVAIDGAGRRRDYPITSLPHGHRDFRSFMAAFSERSPAARDAICAGWLRGVAEHVGPSTGLLRMYHLEWLLSDRRGDRAAPPQRTLVWTCSAKGARETG